MKKVTLVVAIALVIAMVASVCASAAWTGESSETQLEFEIPKKPADREIVIDGKIDLEGEWYGAFKGGIDFQNEDNIEDYCVWDAAVWSDGMDYPVSTFDDIDEKYRLTWNTYLMWSEEGLYFAVVCPNDKNPTTLDVDGFLEDAGIWSRTDGWTPMFCATDDPDVTGYNWVNFWADTKSGEGFWNDDNLVYSSRSTDCPYTIICANDRPETPDADGNYPWYIEGLVSWEAMCYDANGNKYFEDMPAADKLAGHSIRFGNIFLEGAGENWYDEDGTRHRENYIRANDCPGWNHFNIYTLNANPAENNPNAPVVEEPVVEEPVVEEPVVEEPVVEEPVVEEPAPAPAPAPVKPAPTADVSVLFYALAAVSAVGGVAAFRRKK